MKTLTKTFSLKESVVKKIEELADKENRSLSNMVETLILKYIEDGSK